MTRLTALAIQVVCNVGLRELQVQATNLASDGRQQVWAGMGSSVHGTPSGTWAARLAAIAGGGAVMDQDSTVGVRKNVRAALGDFNPERSGEYERCRTLELVGSTWWVAPCAVPFLNRPDGADAEDQLAPCSQGSRLGVPQVIQRTDIV